MTIKPDTKPTGKPRAPHTFDLRRKALHLAVASCFSITPVLAATIPTPTTIGGYTFTTAKNGMVTNDVTSGNSRTISNNNNAILNWGNGLNINTNEKLVFDQCPSCKVLNRVSGGNATNILGTLSSSGKVYLINNAGIVIGAGAHIATNGFVASTLNLSDDDFTNGINRFTASTTDATGGVNNAGTISTPNGGFVYLIGAQVQNSGIITTPSGEAILAAGSSVELVDSADPSMRVKVSAKALPVNLSQLMTNSNGNIFSVLNSGKISANSAVVGQNGKIQLRSAGALTTTSTSVLEAKGDANTNGGLIRGFVDGVGHYSGSFDVSGRNGGSLETSAAFLYLDQGLSVAASAFAAGGHSGKWLLDPYDFDIGAPEASIMLSALNNGISVDVDTGNSYFYGGSSGYTMVNSPGSTHGGRITMTGVTMDVTYAGPVSLTFDADEKVIITNSSITGSGGGFDFEINAGLDRSSAGTVGGVAIIGSTIRTNGGGSLDIYTNTGNIAISGSHLSSSSPTVSGSSTQIDIAAYSGSVNINNSDITFINSTPYAGQINLYADNGDINIHNQSQIGANSGDVNVSIVADSGNVDIGSSSIGVETGSLGSSNVNITANGGNITMTGSDSSHSIRAHQVSLYAQKTIAGTGNIGSSDHSIVTEADNLSIGNYTTQNAYVTDLGVLQNANIQVVNDAELQLQQGAELTSSYGSSINIYANTALIASAGDINLTNSAIDFYTGSGTDGSYVIATSGGILLDNSSISTYASYGGATSLNLISSNLSLDHSSHIQSDFVGVNYSIGGPATDAAKRLALAKFAKNSTVSIGSDSSITGNNGVGIVTGKLDVIGGSITSHSDLDLVVAGDIKIKGENSGGYSASINADTEAFITSGGHMKIDSSEDGTGSASINVASGQTLFMNFVGRGVLNNGWKVDGVANAFDSALPGQKGQTGIFVNGGPGVIGVNTFVTYGKATSIPGVTGTTNNTLLTNPLGNSTIANNQDAADKFFGKDDDSKDEGDGKTGKHKPKECTGS